MVTSYYKEWNQIGSMNFVQEEEQKTGYVSRFLLPIKLVDN